MSDEFGTLYPGRCSICPRACGARRAAGELGFCRSGAGPNIASICAHTGEEPPISGSKGICNIFFSGCNMRCRFCQNHQISRGGLRERPAFRTVHDAMTTIESLRKSGCRNIGFVSPSHVIPEVRQLIAEARARGWKDAVFVYNTNAYDKLETIQSLEKDIGVWLPDFKYADDELAVACSAAPDYPRIAMKAIKEMVRFKGVKLEVSANGTAVSGVIVRHLVMPGRVENSINCLRMLARDISNELHISLMSQYHPTEHVAADANLGRTLTADEYDAVVDELELLGFSHGWVQSLESSANYRPDFERDDPFK